MLYFAYGSNMNFKQMRERCPSSRFIKRAYKEGYKFVYDGRSIKWNAAVANIIEPEENIVWGGLFEINEDNLAALDCYEGYSSKSYDRETIIVKDDEENSLEAVVYLRKGQRIGTPDTVYRQTIIQGAKDCGLPENYIEDNL